MFGCIATTIVATCPRLKNACVSSFADPYLELIFYEKEYFQLPREDSKLYATVKATSIVMIEGLGRGA